MDEARTRLRHGEAAIGPVAGRIAANHVPDTSELRGRLPRPDFTALALGLGPALDGPNSAATALITKRVGLRRVVPAGVDRGGRDRQRSPVRAPEPALEEEVERAPYPAVRRVTSQHEMSDERALKATPQP